MKLNAASANFSMLIATMIWGSTFIVIKKSLANVHAVTFVCYRFALAALVMGIILIFLRKKPWRHSKEGLILGLLLFASYLSQTLALYYMKAVDAGFISGLFVIFVPILSFVCGREKIRLNIIVAIILASVGLWSVTGGIENFGWGEILMLFSVVAFAGHILYADLVVKKCDIWVLNFQQFLVVALAGFLGILLFRLPFEFAGYSVVWAVLYLALFANVLSYAVQLNVQKVISPTVCALIISLEPVFAAAFAWTVGGEKIIITDIIGGLIIITAIIVSQVFRKNEISHVGL